MPYFEQGMFLERYPVCRWDYGLFGKVPLGSGIVDGLERCLRYGVGWKGISFVERCLRYVSGMEQLAY
jgi:hypothetical protein